MSIIKGDILTMIQKEKKWAYKKNHIQTSQAYQIENYPGINVYFADKGWISDVISKNMLAKMKSFESLFISAQTGCGKTTFLFKTCLPIALAENKRIIYLCSRNALAQQIKQIAMTDPINGDVYVGKRQVKEFNKLYTDVGISSLNHFGGIDIYTYQSYIREYKNINHTVYSFVAMDEVHYFLSDSTFNSNTELTIEILLRKFQNTRRIYLTATPKNAIDVVREKELACTNSLYFNPIMNVICMDNDYSYLIPKFFTRVKDLISQVNVRKDDYWLVFVRNIKRGEQLKEDLADLGLQSTIITADTDKESEVFKELLTKETLSEHIIISTKVLDVGVNIRTEGLNIVVFDDDITELKQMIGRKRVSKNEKLKVFFYTPALKELSKRQRNVARNIQTVEKTLFELKNGEIFETIAPPLLFNGTQLDYNSLHLRKLKLEYNHYQNLINQLSGVETEQEQNLMYAKLILAEFDNVEYSEEKLFLQDQKEELKEVLTNYQDELLTSDEFEILSYGIVEILGDPRVKARESAPSASTLNKRLIDFGYKIETSGNPVQYKVVVKGE